MDKNIFPITVTFSTYPPLTSKKDGGDNSIKTLEIKEEQIYKDNPFSGENISLLTDDIREAIIKAIERGRNVKVTVKFDSGETGSAWYIMSSICYSVSFSVDVTSLLLFQYGPQIALNRQARSLYDSKQIGKYGFKMLVYQLEGWNPNIFKNLDENKSYCHAIDDLQRCAIEKVKTKYKAKQRILGAEGAN